MCDINCLLAKGNNMKKTFFSFMAFITYAATSLASLHEGDTKPTIRSELIELIGQERYNATPVVRMETKCDYITDVTPSMVPVQVNKTSPYWMCTGQDTSERFYFSFVLMNSSNDALKTLTIHERYSLPKEYAERRGSTGAWAVGNHDAINAPIYFDDQEACDDAGIYKDRVFTLLKKLLAGETVNNYRLVNTYNLLKEDDTARPVSITESK
jgi:hypothetical protein